MTKSNDFFAVRKALIFYHKVDNLKTFFYIASDNQCNLKPSGTPDPVLDCRSFLT